ncbi:MAG: adenylyl-sulfate kinase [Flavobacteriaceae bacterium]|nr:adenylyl-sulfate kinase [Flavobacteriaceae bacterium]
MTKNIIKHDFVISKTHRNKANKHPSFVLWFTGLSGSGKSTIANAVEEQLFAMGMQTYSLDGDNIRKGINNDLGFSEEERHENLRRIAEVSKLFVDAGIITLASFISPTRKDRAMVKEIVGAAQFFEVFVDTPLHICESRDPKGLYKKARAGEIKNFTGIDAPYEPPLKPDLHLLTENEPLDVCVEKVITFVKQIPI